MSINTVTKLLEDAGKACAACHDTTVRDFLNGQEETIAASALVMATTNVAFDPFPENIPGKTTHRIGDCTAPRLSAYAVHEGLKPALAL